MKIFPYILLALTLYVAYVDNRNFHARNMMMAENAFATGCSAHAIVWCSKDNDVLTRGMCYEYAYENCPKMGLSFKEGLEAAGK